MYAEEVSYPFSISSCKLKLYVFSLWLLVIGYWFLTYLQLITPYQFTYYQLLITYYLLPITND